MIKPAATRTSAGTQRATPAPAEAAVRPEPRGARALDDLVFKQGVVDFRVGAELATPETQLRRAERFLEIIRAGLNPREAEIVPVGAERPEPAGAVNLTDFEVLDSALASKGELTDAQLDILKINDRSVQAFLSRPAVDSKLTTDILGPVAGNKWMPVLRNFVRGAELGEVVQIAPEVWQRQWPETVEAMALLKRAAKAFDLEEGELAFGRGRLDAPGLPEWRLRGEDHATAALLNCLPVLRELQLLANEPGLEPLLREFVERLPVPNDVRGVARNAVFRGQPVPDPGAVPTTPKLDPWAVELAVKSPDSFRVGQGTPVEGVNRASFAEMPTDPSAIDAPETLTRVARMFELTPKDKWGEQGAAWLKILEEASLPRALYYRDDVVAPLMRLASALGLDDATVKVLGADGVKMLRERAVVLALPRTTADFKASLEPFAPKTKASNEERLGALETIVAGSLTSAAVELGAHLAHGVKPIDYAMLDSADQARLIEALMLDTTGEKPVRRNLRHVGALQGLFTVGAEDALQAALIEKKFPEDRVKQWVGIGTRLAKLSGADRAFVVSALEATPYDFELFPLRLSLAETESLTSAEMVERFAKSLKTDPVKGLETLADWAIGRGKAQTKVAKEMFLTLFEQGEVHRADVAKVLTPSRIKALGLGDHEAVAKKAIRAMTEADVVTREGARAQLLSSLRRLLSTRPDAVTGVFDGLLAHDLRRVSPLDEVDSLLGGVSAKAWEDHRSISQRLGLEEEPEAVTQRNEHTMQSRYPATALRIASAKTLLELKAASKLGDLTVEIDREIRAVLAEDGVVDPLAVSVFLKEGREWAERLSDELAQT